MATSCCRPSSCVFQESSLSWASVVLAILLLTDNLASFIIKKIQFIIFTSPTPKFVGKSTDLKLAKEWFGSHLLQIEVIKVTDWNKSERLFVFLFCNCLNCNNRYDNHIWTLGCGSVNWSNVLLISKLTFRQIKWTECKKWKRNSKKLNS